MIVEFFTESGDWDRVCIHVAASAGVLVEQRDLFGGAIVLEAVPCGLCGKWFSLETGGLLNNFESDGV